MVLIFSNDVGNYQNLTWHDWKLNLMQHLFDKNLMNNYDIFLSIMIDVGLIVIVDLLVVDAFVVSLLFFVFIDNRYYWFKI